MTQNARRRLSPDQRKAEIVAAALPILSRTGYWGLTFAEVAAQAGVTLQTVAHYFPTKDDLMLRILLQRDQEDQLVLAGSEANVKSAEDFIEITLDLIRSNINKREIVRLYAVLQAESLNMLHPANGYFTNRVLTATSAIEKLIKPWHPNPKAAAIMVHAIMDGLQMLWLRDEDFEFARHWSLWAKKYFDVR